MFKNLFGRKPTQPTGAAADLVRSYGAYLINPSTQTTAAALESWTWLPLPNGPPLFVNVLGDCFFETPQGVARLDVTYGKLEIVAESVAALKTGLADAEWRDDLLGASLVEAAKEIGLQRAPNECFDWLQPLAAGGEATLDNLTATDFEVCVHLAGQLHDQLRKLPPGTKVNIRHA